MTRTNEEVAQAIYDLLEEHGGRYDHQLKLEGLASVSISGSYNLYRVARDLERYMSRA